MKKFIKTKELADRMSGAISSTSANNAIVQECLDELVKMWFLNPNIYKVTGLGDDRHESERILGYATGSPDEIKVFFDNKRHYGIRLEPIEITHVDLITIGEKNKKLARIKELEEEIKRLKHDTSN